MTDAADRETASRAPCGDRPMVSVIIASYDRPHDLERCLRSLAGQTYPDYEIVVVDDASPQREAYESLARGYGARLVRHEVNRGQAAGRNRGVRESRGDLIIFLDDDCEAESATWMTRHVARHAEHPRLVLQGRNRFQTATLASRAWAVVNEPGTPHVDHLETVNLSLTRRAFDAIGGFDESHRELEDVDFSFRARRAGWRLVYDEDLAVTHYCRTTLRGVVRRAHEYGLRTVPVRKGRRLPFHWLLPPSFLAGLVMLVPLAFARAAIAVISNVGRFPDAPVYFPLILLFCLSHTAGMVRYYRRPDMPGAGRGGRPAPG